MSVSLDDVQGLTIGEFAHRTGVAEGTLRMWERRHGFPCPQRLAGGHRRYREADIELVRRVTSERTDGLSLAAAIARAENYAAIPAPSVFAALRRARPDLEPQVLRKPLLLALTHAIEDESLARAERPVLFASFQSQRFYRQAQPRWRELSRGAKLAAVFADFDRGLTPRSGPVEIPVDRSHPLSREWTVVCCAPDHAVCLTAREPPGSSGRVDHERVFETIWSVERSVAWDAAHICAGIAATTQPDLIEPIKAHLQADLAPTDPAQLRLATAITNRALAYLS